MLKLRHHSSSWRGIVVAVIASYCLAISLVLASFSNAQALAQQWEVSPDAGVLCLEPYGSPAHAPSGEGHGGPATCADHCVLAGVVKHAFDGDEFVVSNPSPASYAPAATDGRQAGSIASGLHKETGWSSSWTSRAPPLDA